MGVYFVSVNYKSLLFKFIHYSKIIFFTFEITDLTLCIGHALYICTISELYSKIGFCIL